MLLSFLKYSFALIPRISLCPTLLIPVSPQLLLLVGSGVGGVGEVPLSNALSEGVLQGSVLDLYLITHVSLGQGHI